jgi:hypothetical protein
MIYHKTIEIDISLNAGTDPTVFEWLNIAHAGKPLIPLDEPVSAEHKEAAHHLGMCHRITVLLELEISDRGEVRLIKATPDRVQKASSYIDKDKSDRRS